MKSSSPIRTEICGSIVALKEAQAKAKVDRHQEKQALSNLGARFSLELGLLLGRDPLNPLDTPRVFNDPDVGALGSHVLVDLDVLATLEEAHFREGAVARNQRGRVELVGKLQDGAESSDNVLRGRVE